MNTVDRSFSTSATGLTSDDINAVFANLPLLFVRFDREGKCLEANSSPTLMAAIDTAALSGRHLDDLVRSNSQAIIDPAQIANQPRGAARRQPRARYDRRPGPYQAK